MGYFLPENKRKYAILLETGRNGKGKYLSCGRFSFTFWHKMVVYYYQAFQSVCPEYAKEEAA